MNPCDSLLARYPRECRARYVAGMRAALNEDCQRACETRPSVS